jgi:type IV pilus assembly protein PilV
MNPKRSLPRQAGSVLLEALIAILIFSIGILALVGMQATAINSVSDAKYRSTAGFLADQIVGSIWATRQGTIIANASNVMVATPDPLFACNPCTTTNGNAYTRAWVASGVSQLPTGTGSIIVSAPVVTVTLTWQPPKHDSSPGVVTHRHTVSTFIN